MSCILAPSNAFCKPHRAFKRHPLANHCVSIAVIYRVERVREEKNALILMRARRVLELEQYRRMMRCRNSRHEATGQIQRKAETPEFLFMLCNGATYVGGDILGGEKERYDKDERLRAVEYHTLAEGVDRAVEELLFFMHGLIFDFLLQATRDRGLLKSSGAPICSPFFVTALSCPYLSKTRINSLMNAPKPSEMSLCESIPVTSCPKPGETCAAIAPTVRVAQGEAVLLRAQEDIKMSTILARSQTALDEEDTLEAAAILSRHVILPPRMPTEEASQRAPVASSAIPDSQRFERRSAILVSASSKRYDRRPVDPPASACSGKGKSELSMLSLGGKLDGALMHSELLRVRDALPTLQQHVTPASTKQTAAEKVERKAKPEATVVRNSRRKLNSGVPGARRASKMPSSSLTPSQLRHEAVKKRRALVDAATAAEGEARCARTVERHAAAAATRA
eukprot:IDg23658t1